MGLITAWSAGLILFAASAACAQASGGSRAQVMLSSGEMTPVAPLGPGLQGEVVREIDDPNNGDRWLLLRNDQFPGGPGRLVLIAAHRNASGGSALQAAGQAGEAQILPVIRAGDRLIVEEHTAHVDSVLEARAMNPAAPGAAFDVRLTIGGHVVRALALGPGRAALQPEAGMRP